MAKAAKPAGKAPLIDPFIVIMLALVAAASVMPVRGLAAQVLEIAADLSIVLLFFLHGAKLSRAAVMAGFSNLRLHSTVVLVTFALFPLLGLAGRWALSGQVAPGLLNGLLFLCLLPSTVQSSIAFTAIARGNVAAAVCAAALSSLLGIFLTPALVAVLMGAAATITGDSIWRIVLQLLLPFLLGHLARPLIGGWVDRHRKLVGRVDRSSILLIVYTAFSASVVQGLWSQVGLRDMVFVFLAAALILAFVLSFTWWLSRVIGLERAERIVLLFAGSKKSLAAGVPIASTLFPAVTLGPLLLPLMLFHQMQLIVCATLAPIIGRGGAEPEPEPVAEGEKAPAA